MRSNMEQTFFCMWTFHAIIIYRTSYHLSQKGEEGGGGSEIEIIVDIFLIIYRHELVDTNWAPTENIYRFF